jgi:hypothetical protein
MKARRMYMFSHRALTGVIMFAVLAGGVTGAVITGMVASEGHPAPSGVITEDMPGWDCATMGNGTCGPTHDLTDPFDRCLSAVESAELPAWVWECHQTPAPVIKPQG